MWIELKLSEEQKLEQNVVFFTNKKTVKEGKETEFGRFLLLKRNFFFGGGEINDQWGTK